MGSVKRISLGIPTRGDVCIETTMALLNMLVSTPHEFHLNFHKGTYLSELRNDILAHARKADADYLMFVDTDIVFPPDGVSRLLAHGKDVVGGLYNMKQLPPISTIKIRGPDGKMLPLSGANVPTDRIFQVFTVPTGFMLIRLEAIKDFVKPFDFMRKPDGEFVGEDVAFCTRCADAGIEVWCDPTIKIGHIGSYVY